MKKEVKPIILDTEACYAALASHDARFDGRFFIGVSSTGIYCRPVCRVKLPKKENCLFFANAASAEAEGFRPCLKCRPELAPGNSSIDSVSRIARKAASLIEEGYLEDHNLTSVTDDTCHRTVLVRRKAKVYRGWISVANVPRRNSHSLTMSSGLLPVLSPVLARVRAIFDTNCDPVEIYEKLQTMNEISPKLPMPGIRLPGCFDPFEMSVRAILGQQITVKAARTLAMRFSKKFGEKLATPWQELSLTFPEPEAICALSAPIADHLGPLGITAARANSILSLAKAMTSGSINLYNSSNPLIEMEKLLELPGFGPWTVQYIGMRAMGWPNAFPHTDYGVKKALANVKAEEIPVMAKKWQPWRSYATINLWNSLEGASNEQKS